MPTECRLGRLAQDWPAAGGASRRTAFAIGAAVRQGVARLFRVSSLLVPLAAMALAGYHRFRCTTIR